MNKKELQTVVDQFKNFGREFSVTCIRDESPLRL